MSGPHDQPPTAPPSDQYDPNYSMYETHTGRIYPGIPDTPSAFDRVAFWYRPEPQEPMYHADTSSYNQATTMQGTQMETSAGVKHRRTRSGCFTCRSRRVKCDETRPICDRCRKGNRECEFPLQSTSSKRQKSGEPRSAISEARLSSSKDATKLDTIQDEAEGTGDEEEEEEIGEEEEEDNESHSPKTVSSRPKLHKLRTQSGSNINRKQKRRQRSDVSSTPLEKVSSPSTETSEPFSAEEPPFSADLTPTTTNASATSYSQHWKRLKPDLTPEIEFCLHFQREHMTYYHYFFKLDPDDFVHNELINLALQYEPLLYAVVAFAAYHHTLQLPDSEADFNFFWKYYCKSIMSLRKWLEKHTERNEAVLLTILQLAAFEEYLGDWPNLAVHHKAAHRILVTLYKPDTVTETYTSRRIFDWYTRFDVISGIIAVREATLGREWLATVQAWYEDRTKMENSGSIELLESIVATLRLIGFDVAHLLATANGTQSQQPGSPKIDDTTFVETLKAEAESIAARMDEFRQRVEQLNNIHLTATEVAPLSAEEDSLFNPHIPLFRDALWPLNFVWIDWYAIEQIRRYQTFVFLQRVSQMRQQHNEPFSEPPFPSELSKLSLLQCQIYEAIERASGAPAGAVLGCHASIGMSTVFLPKPPPDTNNKFVMWARRKLANIERMGYVWPPHFRQRMAQLWDEQSIEDWWLPNGEGKFRLLEEIRTVVEDRNLAAAEQMQRTGKDDGGAGLREIKALFEGLELARPGSSRGSVSGEAFLAGHRVSVSSTSEAGSSNASNTGFSPAGGNLVEGEAMLAQASTKKRSRTNVASPTALMRPPIATHNEDRMSGVWEEVIDEGKEQ